MKHMRIVLWLFGAAALVMGACTLPAQHLDSPADDGVSTAAASAAASVESEAEFQRILSCVEENFPAESYFTNDLLPVDDGAWEPVTCEKVDRIKVAMAWILNDGEAPWYNALEQGYFADVCLEVELVGGGPTVAPLQTLVEGQVDIAVVSAGRSLPWTVAGPDGADLVAVGSFLLHSPYAWLGLDVDTPQELRSGKTLTPQDFAGKTIGIHAGEEAYVEFISRKYGIPADQFDIVETGVEPDRVLTGEIDYAGAWLINEPRFLEERGYNNWVAFLFSDWGWDDYGDVSVVRRELVDDNPDLVRRYLAALYRGTRFLLQNPELSAETALVYGVDAELDREQILRRFELQEPLIAVGEDGTMVRMSAARWNAQVASMIQYDQMQLATCK